MEPEVILDAMPENERTLLRAALASDLDGAEPAWLETASARLRNLAETYAERIKRSRLDARAGRPVEPADVLRARAELIETARERIADALAADRAGQDPDPGVDAGS
jgi:hypothetical protein